MSKIKKFFLVLFCFISITGCSTFKNYTGAPSVENATTTKIASLGNQRFKATTSVTNWWQKLQDKQLNVLIKNSLAKNKDIIIASANLSVARSLAQEAGFDNYPSIKTPASVMRKRTSGELGLGNSQTNNILDAGFDLSWELDLFGSVAEKIKATGARAQAVQANLRDVYVSIAAEVARNYIELRGAQHRLDIAQRNAANQQETYQITQNLVSGGRGTLLDVTRAQTQLNLTKSNIPLLKAEITAKIHSLSVLTGQVPDTLRAELTSIKPLPNIPATIHLGNVSDLLRRRPDIVAAEKYLAAAIFDYNVAVAEQFPSVNLVGALGLATTAISSLGTSAIAASLGLNINWLAFDMGRIKSRIRQNDALAQAAIAKYEKSVLRALEELQTSVSNFSHEEERRSYLYNAARSGKEAAKIARERYKSGIDTFVDVLNTELTLLQAEDTLAQSEINAALYLILVYKALGGGWEHKE